MQTQTSVVLLMVTRPTTVRMALQEHQHPHKHQKQPGSQTLLLSYPVKRGRAPDMKWSHTTVHPHVSWPSAPAARVKMCFKVHEHNTQGLQL